MLLNAEHQQDGLVMQQCTEHAPVLVRSGAHIINAGADILAGKLRALEGIEDVCLHPVHIGGVADGSVGSARFCFGTLRSLGAL